MKKLGLNFCLLIITKFKITKYFKMKAYIVSLLMTSIIFLSACKPRECEIPDAPPFTEDQLSWIDSTSYNFRVTYQGSDGLIHVDTVRSYHTSHKGPSEGRTGSGVRCEQAIRYYTGSDEWNVDLVAAGWCLSTNTSIESRERFLVKTGPPHVQFTNDPRIDTATILGILYDKVYKNINSTQKCYISKSHGVIYVEGITSGIKAEILPQQN
jgi:hypothetical protein